MQASTRSAILNFVKSYFAPKLLLSAQYLSDCQIWWTCTNKFLLQFEDFSTAVLTLPSQKLVTFDTGINVVYKISWNLYFKEIITMICKSEIKQICYTLCRLHIDSENTLIRHFITDFLVQFSVLSWHYESTFRFGQVSKENTIPPSTCIVLRH